MQDLVNLVPATAGRQNDSRACGLHGRGRGRSPPSNSSIKNYGALSSSYNSVKSPFDIHETPTERLLLVALLSVAAL